MNFRTSISHLIVAFALLISCFTNALAESPRSQPISPSDALSTAEKWASVVGQGDIAGLNALLHNDYVHIHATALVESKLKFIEALQSGARRYDPIRIEDSNVRAFGDSALVSGKFVLKATTRDRVIEGVNRFVLLIVNTPNGMQVANFQATAIPQPK